MIVAEEVVEDEAVRVAAAAAALIVTLVLVPPAVTRPWQERDERPLDLLGEWPKEKEEETLQMMERRSKDARTTTVSGSSSFVVSYDHHSHFSPSERTTEKGFCILGENCPYDHGLDPLVIGGPYVHPQAGMPPIGVPTLPSQPPPGEK